MTQDEYNKPSSISESRWSLVDKGPLGLKVGGGGWISELLKVLSVILPVARDNSTWSFTFFSESRPV